MYRFMLFIEAEFGFCCLILVQGSFGTGCFRVGCLNGYFYSVVFYKRGF